MSNGLPNVSAAVIDARKIIEYALSDDHPRGRNKARVFASVLGLTAGNAEVLIGAIRKAAMSGPVVETRSDRFGQRYVLDFSMTHSGRSAVVRTCWMVRHGEDFARLTSCYVP